MASPVQAVLNVIYPHQCVLCAEPVQQPGLCPACWPKVSFVQGLCCDACGAPLPGEGPRDTLCDDCLETPRPWSQGRAAFTYQDGGRSLVLGLKHGDRHDVVAPAVEWMARAGGDILDTADTIVPVPLHWTRLFKRKYNQAALLARGLAKRSGARCVVNALVRVKRTTALDGISREDRFAILENAIRAHPHRGLVLKGQQVVIVDDVMTSGATYAACTKAAFDVGAAKVSVLHLARVCRYD